jgi:hypothetical protein
MENEKKRPRDNDRFMATMTFANAEMTKDCDCDECGTCFMPKDIVNAVELYKRQAMMSNNVSSLISQKRSLVQRYDGVSIWKLTLPPSARALTEFGNSHRFILVDYIKENRVVKSIGKGIIGSSSEEASRCREHWEGKKCYFYPSNGGKAIGWINEKMDEDEKIEVSETIHDVVLYTIKITNDMLEQLKESQNSFTEDTSERYRPMPKWVCDILEIGAKYLAKSIQHDSSSSPQHNQRIETAGEDSREIRKKVDQFIQKSALP